MYSYVFLRLHRNQWNELTHATPLPLIAFVRPSTDNKNLLPSGSHCLRTLIIIIIFFLFFSRHVRKGHVCNEQQPISHINGDDTEQCEQRPSKYACTKARRYGFDSFSIQNVVQYPIDENLSSILISVSFFTMQNILNYRFFFSSTVSVHSFSQSTPPLSHGLAHTLLHTSSSWLHKKKLNKTFTIEIYRMIYS